VTLFKRYERIPGHPIFEHVAETGSLEQAQKLAKWHGTGRYVLTRDHEPPRGDQDPYIAAKLSVQPDRRVRVTERRP
jgi:hypothetical protein